MKQPKIINRVKRIFPIIKIYISQGLRQSLRKDRRDKIVFIIPDGGNITGGILSIVNMVKISRELFPKDTVYLGVFKRFQKWDRIKGLPTGEKIINIRRFLKTWLKHGDKIIFNVYEGGVPVFLTQLEKMGLLENMNECTLNILNQNQDLMPTDEKIARYARYFKMVTMTLAFKTNESLSFPYLSFPAMHVGAYFEGNAPERVPYLKKENLCVLSVDNNPYKEKIRQKLESAGIKCYDKYPIAFTDFVNLQKKAKWTISFGEGWDGYSMGQFQNGGIGFGVFQENFTTPYLKRDSLPRFLFTSYEDMSENILKEISYYDDERIYEEENKKWAALIDDNPDSNSEEKVRERWINYYKKTGKLQ